MRCFLAGLVTSIVSVVLIGCGDVALGFSGVALHKRVGALSEGEMRDLCAWVIGRQGGEGAMHDCGNGLTVTLDTIDECVDEQDDFSDCSLTVAQMEDCVLQAGPDPCAALSTPACQPLGQCRF